MSAATTCQPCNQRCDQSRTCPARNEPTVHQHLTEAMFPKAICRKCSGLFVAETHSFDECTAYRSDLAMLADKKNGGYERRALAAGLKEQQKLIDCGVMS